MRSVHVNDVGTVFKATVIDENGSIVDVSTMQSGTFFFKKPDGTKIQKTASIYTNGTDGILSYVTVAGDINMNGLWSLQSQVVFSGQTYFTDIYDFRVERNL